MEVVAKEQVDRLVQMYKEDEFVRVINQLEAGAALRISPHEFKMRFDTPVPHYFLGKFNREKKTVSCRRFGEYYYIIKL